jgi:mercuric ion transport protein
LSRRLIAGGIVGSVVAALCCFTPILVVLLGAVGLSAWLGYADYVVMPALVFFLLLTVFALNREQRRRTESRHESWELSNDRV